MAVWSNSNRAIGDATVAAAVAALEHENLANLAPLNHGHAAGLCGSDPSPAWLERRQGTKGEEQPLRAARQRLEAHRGIEAMQQPHTKDLAHPLALHQRIHQQNAAQSLPLMPLVNGEVAEEYSGNQVGARWPGGGLRRQIGCANGMGIDGIALLASGRATKKLSCPVLPQRKSLLS
jgi:hypothetical protein